MRPRSQEPELFPHMVKLGPNPVQEFIQTDLRNLEMVVTVYASPLIGTTLYQVEMKIPDQPSVYCQRRFNDFYALHKVLNMKFSLIDWPPFPPKNDLPIKKHEKRKNAFNLLLNYMVRMALEHSEIRVSVLKLLYFFVMRDLSGKDKPVQPVQVPQNKQQIERMGTVQSQPEGTTIDEQDESFVEQQQILMDFVNSEQPPLSGFDSTIQMFQKGAEALKNQFLEIKPKGEQNEKINPSLSAKSPTQKDFDYQAEIPNYGQYVMVRFSKNDEYQQFYARIEGPNLFMFSHINQKQNSFSLQICIYDAKVVKDHTHIEIYHDPDYSKIDLTVEGEVPTRNRGESNLLRTMDHKLKVLYNQLKIAIYKTDGLQFLWKNLDSQYSNLNIILVKEALNVQNIPVNSLLSVQIKLPPFTCKTKMHVKSENPCWRQDFMIPITDTYGILQLELINIVHDGILYKHQKELVIGTAQILIADILSYHSDQKIKSLHLPLTPTESKRSISCDEGAGQDKQEPQIVVSIKNLSSVASIFSHAKINQFEGEKLDPNLQEVKIHIIRFKRIVGLLGRFALAMEDIIDQRYPRLTALFLSFMFLLFLLGDLSYFLSYFCGLLLIILVYQNPFIKPTIYGFFKDHILNVVHPDYMVPDIMTESEFELLKSSQDLHKLLQFDGKEVKVDKEFDKKGDDQENIMQQIRKVQKQIYIIQVYLTWFASFAEKVMNLFTWKEYKRTLLFVTALFVIFCVVRALPLRYMIMTGLVVEWFDGKKVYKKRQTRNRQMAAAVMEYIYKKYLPGLTKSSVDPENQLHYTRQEWPSKDFKLKVAEQYKLHLDIHTDSELMAKYSKPIEFINALQYCTTKLKLKRIIDANFKRDELYNELKKACRFKQKPHQVAAKIFQNFMYNIPSEYFRFKHPRKLHL